MEENRNKMLASSGATAGVNVNQYQRQQQDYQRPFMAGLALISKLERATREFDIRINAIRLRNIYNAGHQYTPKKKATNEMKPVLYKTQMCTNLQIHGCCKFGPGCWFAHDTNELRSVPSHLPNTPIPSSSSAHQNLFFGGPSNLFDQQPTTSTSSMTTGYGDGAMPVSGLFSNSDGHAIVDPRSFYSVPNRIIHHRG